MDGTDELHPNWRALATIHLSLKRFVREGANAQETGVRNERGQKYEIKNVHGKEAKDFYETLTKDSTTNAKTKKNKEKTSRKTDKPTILEPKTRFDAATFYCYATQNNAKGLQEFQYKADDINVCDTFGWTALMMAACEGASAAVKVLLELGAKKELVNKSGKTALDLAKLKTHWEIVDILKKSKITTDQIEINQEVQHLFSNEPYYCDICKRTFVQTNYQQHLTSTVHQFNVCSTMPANKLQKFNIPPKNRGLQLMVKQGWDKESGLGPENSGRLYPVKTVIRKQRTGLGIEQPPARVTHFDAFDLRATRNSNSDYYKSKPRNRNDMRREKRREWKQERRLRRELS